VCPQVLKPVVSPEVNHGLGNRRLINFSLSGTKVVPCIARLPHSWALSRCVDSEQLSDSRGEELTGSKIRKHAGVFVF